MRSFWSVGGRSRLATLAILGFSWSLASVAEIARPSASAGSNLPLIDLAGETERQVIVDREPGQYLGHPTTVLLEDGRTILCAYPRGHGRGAIQLQRSSDGGRTWSGRLPVPENWATSLETPTLHRVIDALGTKRLVIWSGLYPARLAVSSDDGTTWSPLQSVGDWGGIVVMGSLEPVAGEPGHYLAWFHDDGRYLRANAQPTRPVTFALYQVESRDGGLTWSAPRELFASTSIHLCEPGAVRSPDGHQLALLLRENSRRRNSHVIFSNDEGHTWSPPRELPDALTGDRHTAKYAPDGRLLVSFRDTHPTSATQGDWVGWVGTYDDLRYGRAGQYRVRFMDNHHAWDCAYPGVEVLPDGTFVTTTYGHWVTNEPPYVVSVRFTLKELDARLPTDRPGTAPTPPGVVVAHASAAGQQYLGSPSLAAIPNGELLASHDFFGPGSTKDTLHVYGSTNQGVTWQRRSETKGFWSSLFWHRDALYLLGTSRQEGSTVIRRSTDGGRTWTEPTEAKSGRLLADGKYHCAPMPVIEHDGRVWRAMEDLMGSGGWATYFRSFVMSAPSDSDLLDARNWTYSNPLSRDPTWLNGKFGGWLEGNVTVTPSGQVVNVLRVDDRETEEKAAIIQISADGRTGSFEPTTGFITLPGGCKKFTIRQDPRDGTYWAMSNWIPPAQRGGAVDRTRNTLALLHSTDLHRWDLHGVLLHHPDRERHAFQYPDFQFDGNDLIALIRTAFDDDTGGAPNGHDANFITFHRWTGFRAWRTNTLPPAYQP